MKIIVIFIVYKCRFSFTAFFLVVFVSKLILVTGFIFRLWKALQHVKLEVVFYD